jgi:Zn-dependent peptidase ImmA (M78 family)
MPIGSLSKAIGMEIESKKLDVLGWFDSDLSKIFVDKKQDAFYQRFIIAHELGHYAAGDGSSYMKSPPKYTEQEHIKEKKANTFAAELLIPQITLLEKIKETNDSDDLSLFFEVPKEIMVARLLEL